MDKETEIILKLSALRGCGEDHLPIDKSSVAYDLLLQVMIAYKTNQTLSVKTLFASVPHSYTAIRHHYKRLLKDEWLSHRLDRFDARIKYIEPTSKLIKTIEGFVKSAYSILNSPLSPTFNQQRKIE
jgi:hypothetical protein